MRWLYTTVVVENVIGIRGLLIGRTFLEEGGSMERTLTNGVSKILPAIVVRKLTTEVTLT